MERVLAKDSFMQIITDLTKEGVPSPGHSSRRTTGKRSDSKQWYTTTLRSLLANPQLLGQVIEDGKPILRTDGLPLVNRPPILDMDTWQALQDELTRRANPGEKRREGTSLLRGILHCSVCGERMYTFTGAKGSLRYRCIGPLKYRQRAGKGKEAQGQKCYGPTVAGDSTENYITDEFIEKYGHLPVMRMVQEVGEDFRPQIRQAEEALADLQKDRYDRGLFKGDDGAKRYAEQYAKLEDRLESLKEKQRTAKPGGVTAEPTGETHAEQWKRSDMAGKRDLLLSAGGYVEVASSKRGGKKLDTSRLAVHFGEEGHMRRAAAVKKSGRDDEPSPAAVED